MVWQQQNYEITTFRTESGYQDFRRPDQVTFVRSLQDDLKRRDFTINALAVRSTGEIIDLFSGIQDLQHHEIQAVGQANERFHEDALRMMRAVRFQSQLIGLYHCTGDLSGHSNQCGAIKKNRRGTYSYGIY